MNSDHSNNEEAEHPPRGVKFGREDFFIVTASESEGRARALLPSKPSEDACRILGQIDIPSRPSEDELQEYLPLQSIEWVISCDFGQRKMAPEAIANAFDVAWRQRFGGFTAYGKDADSGLWTFLQSGDGPKSVTAAKFAWQLGEAEQAEARELFESRLREVAKRMSALGSCRTEASLDSAKAVRRSAELTKLKQQFGLDAVLVLVSTTKPFDGKDVWDVLQCLGLRWGDMDCFHWDNPDDAGDQAFFSVQTSTAPGYFLPEQVAAGKMNPADLQFVFSIPRSASPVQVAKAMFRAVQYCQSRLGGRITFGDGKDVDALAMERELADIAGALTAQGFPPGSSAALRFF